MTHPNFLSFPFFRFGPTAPNTLIASFTDWCLELCKYDSCGKFSSVQQFLVSVLTLQSISKDSSCISYLIAFLPLCFADIFSVFTDIFSLSFLSLKNHPIFQIFLSSLFCFSPPLSLFHLCFSLHCIPLFPFHWLFSLHLPTTYPPLSRLCKH